MNNYASTAMPRLRATGHNARVKVAALVATATIATVAMFAFTAPAANASVGNCISYGKYLFAVTGGNFGATIGALRNTPGCGDTLSSAVCWVSRQWWGGGARWVIGEITNGRYHTC
jgi:hypothetical protein